MSEAIGSSGPQLRLIQGGGQRREESLETRDAVARVLMEAGVDLLLKRITPLRAETIEREVDEVLALFDRVDAQPVLAPILERRLDELELLVDETRVRRQPRRRLRQH